MMNKQILTILGLSIVLIILIGIIVLGSNANNAINANSITSSNTNLALTSTANIEVSYDTTDTNSSWNENSSTKIILNDNSTTVNGTGASVNGNIITITKGGTYYITGTLSDGCIIINAKDEEVQLVLSSVNIHCNSSAPIYGYKAEKIIITLDEGTTNIIEDSSNNSTASSDEEQDGAIYCKTDLVINGTGSLVIKANYADGIVSKDGLIIISGSITINAKDDAIRGKDYVVISDGTFNIIANGDGIKSTNDTDSNLAYIVIEGGDFNIAVGDDGIHAETKIKITNGSINITKSCEGIEAGYIEIDGGEINLVSSDDGINIAGGTNNFNGNTYSTVSNNDRKLIINGGTIYVNANGDGLDANGSIYINGGYTVVYGPTSNGNASLDYDGTCIITGGTLIALGSTGMLQTPSTSSTQYTICAVVSGNANQSISLKDNNGNELLSFTPTKTYQSIIVSSPGLENGKTYTLYSNNNELASVTVNSIVSTYGNIGNGMMNFDGNFGGNMKGGKKFN